MISAHSRPTQALVESALYDSHGRLPNLAKIFKNTKGVVFLSTPHRGSDKASLASIIGNVGALVLRQPNKQLLESLQPSSSTLENLRDAFTTVSQNLRIICVREEKPTAIGIVSFLVKPYATLLQSLFPLFLVRLSRKLLPQLMDTTWNRSASLRIIWEWLDILLGTKSAISGFVLFSKSLSRTRKEVLSLRK